MANEHERLREVRLSALAADPEAFGSTHEHELGYPPECWEQWARSSEQGLSQRTFVALSGRDDWVGLSLVSLSVDEPALAELFAMWVAPTTRGRGAAGMLCDACAAWAAEHGAHQLRLVVVVGNTPALHAYQAAGFAVAGETTWVRVDGVRQEHLVMIRQV
jgi:RimJ/RimL family protein N-acetyltransferase